MVNTAFNYSSSVFRQLCRPLLRAVTTSEPSDVTFDPGSHLAVTAAVLNTATLETLATSKDIVETTALILFPFSCLFIGDTTRDEVGR